MKPLPTGIYEVGMIVRDLQGFGEKQTTKVTICQCRAGVCLAKKSSVALGPMGALALFLPLALLLLLCESLTAVTLVDLVKVRAVESVNCSE